MTLEPVTLLKTYYAAKDAYYEGNPVMTDSEFDAIEHKLAASNPEILNDIGSVERGGKTLLPTPMGSLNQLQDQGALDRWLAKFPTKTKIVSTEKIDGNSCLLQYKAGRLVNSYSRGNGTHGANNIRHTSKMSNIPRVLYGGETCTVRGELVIRRADWVIVQKIAAKGYGSNPGKTYANSRNFVAGFMNASESNPALYPYFVFVAFETNEPKLSKSDMLDLLSSNAFTIPLFTVFDKDAYSFEQYQTMVAKMIKNSDYELDGVVIDINNFSLRDQAVDLTDLNPSHARKIKQPSKAVSTTVTMIEWNVSKDGLLKPIVHFDPVELTGVTIRKASGYNAKNVFDRGIGVGAIVLITRQGDVIPRVDEVVVSVKADMPDHCEWDENEVELISNSTAHGAEIAKQRLEYFFSKMEIDFMGTGNVQKLIHAGINNAEKAIKSVDQFGAICGENGRKSAAIMREKLAATTPERFLAAIGVFGRGIGERKLKALFAVIPFKNFMRGQVTENQIVAVDGFEIRTAEKILSRLPTMITQLNLIDKGVTFMKETTQTVVTTGKFVGQVFCPTGVRFIPEIAAKITSQGGVITDTFNSSVTTLVAKDPDSNSGKVEKAKKKGIPVISLAQLQESFYAKVIPLMMLVLRLILDSRHAKVFL